MCRRWFLSAILSVFFVYEELFGSSWGLIGCLLAPLGDLWVSGVLGHLGASQCLTASLGGPLLTEASWVPLSASWLHLG